MPKFRSPVLGFNHNLRHNGRLFHVQTEDSGIQSPHIYTHLFHDGVICASKKLEYDPEADNEVVKGLMQAQHKSVMKELKAGAFDEKIRKYFGSAVPTSVEGPAAVPPATSGRVAAPSPDEAAMTIPSPPPVAEPEVEEAEGSSSMPYAVIAVADAELLAMVSGTLVTPDEPARVEPVPAVGPPPPLVELGPVVMLDEARAVAAPEPAAPVAPLDEVAEDAEIAGLLSRLEEEDTPVPELIPASHGVGEGDNPGTWLVSRPGQKERPFERSEPIPVLVQDGSRRHVTPPNIPEVAAPPAPAPTYTPRRKTLPQTPTAPPPAGSARPAQQTPPARAPSGTMPLVRPPGVPSGQLPAVRPPPSGSSPPTGKPPSIPPARTPPPAAARPLSVPPGRTPPVLPRPGVNVTPRPTPERPLVTSPMRSQPLVPPTPPRAGAPSHATATRTPPVRPQPASHRRSTSPAEGVVVARPAVVIGAPSQVIGGTLGESGSHRRGHGREPTPPAREESLFGQDLISEKSLDEVIMAYLSEDSGED